MSTPSVRASDADREAVAIPLAARMLAALPEDEDVGPRRERTREHGSLPGR